MSDTANGPGGRLPLLGEDELSDVQRGVWDRLMATQVPEAQQAGFTARTSDGRFVGPFNAYLRFPGSGAALLDWAGAQGQDGALSPVARQVVTLSVGAVWKAPYEVQAHVAAARAAGVAQGAIEAVLQRADSDRLPDDARVARQLADALLIEHRVEQDLYDRAIAVIDEAGVAAVAHLVGQYVAVSSLLLAFDVPAVEPVADPARGAGSS